MRTLINAHEAREATFSARRRIWSEFKEQAAAQIDKAVQAGQCITRIVPHPNANDLTPLVDELKALGYVANITPGDAPTIMVSWRVSWREPKLSK
jgi:hypothetical protein